ncbi:Gfo/Idh/MocA family oxidoreductase [Pseudoruegeria sp. HB172150]|uniref:Gfo/Idh/MocA family oxidoreductase n=1 Tax=Pseudoruegeria sp. HB172150 TaxID=2721164 RepID=UPI001557F9D6|nr:Gfo/Idh/MocA family oxidoreductase [Pseudoruegeria sp. HB172150]
MQPSIGDAEWFSLRGNVDPRMVMPILSTVAASLDLDLRQTGPARAELHLDMETPLALAWRETPLPARMMQRHLAKEVRYCEIIVSGQREALDRRAEQFVSQLSRQLECYSADELNEILRSLPLLRQFAAGLRGAFEGWSIIFRDHFLEDTLGLALTLLRCDLPPDQLLVLAKGDRTQNRHRVQATIERQGVETGVLDNSVIDGTGGDPALLAQAEARIETFISRARAKGRRVMVIDDGGLIAWFARRGDAGLHIDAAVELTVAGLKRIAALGQLDLPVFNMAQSNLKHQLGYHEIADACMKRIREMLPGYKLRGRAVLLLGYGVLGERLAQRLRDAGAHVSIVDPDILRLIIAAEAGYSTYRNARTALLDRETFLICGASGEMALSDADLDVLPDGVFLAPFATRDFSVLRQETYMRSARELPFTGLRFQLDETRKVTLLGDGRSLNLFEGFSIPNECYDIFKAGALLATAELCRSFEAIGPGVHTVPVNDVITRSGLFEAYYDRYLSRPGNTEPEARTQDAFVPALHGANVAVVGYGVAGRLHARILKEYGANVCIVDPRFQNLPDTYQVDNIPELMASLGDMVRIWTVSCPTHEHLNAVSQILQVAPGARILLEKPACQANEIGLFQNLLASHPQARIVIVDQYRHSSVIDRFCEIAAAQFGEAGADQIEIRFHKDRGDEIETGRFVDHSYGVLGYEWLHMLTILERVLSADFDSYCAQGLARSEFSVKQHPRLINSAVHETTLLQRGAKDMRISLSSDILRASETTRLGPPPGAADASEPWRKGLRSADTRERVCMLRRGTVSATLYLDPVTTQDGWQLPRNHHRIVVTRDGAMICDDVFADSPMHNALKIAINRLAGTDAMSPLDIRSLQRISEIAAKLRAGAATDLPEPGHVARWSAE